MPDKVDAASGNDDTPQTPPVENIQAVEEAQDEVAKNQKRIRDLEATKVGRKNKGMERELAELRAQHEESKARLAELTESNRRLQEGYYANATEEEKARIRRNAESRTLQEAERTRRENATLKAIVDEENPMIKSLLSASLKRGEPLSRKQIEALREEFETFEIEEDEKDPPKVTGARTTGQPAVTLNDRKEKAKKDKDITALMNILAEEQKLKNSGVIN